MCKNIKSLQYNKKTNRRQTKKLIIRDWHDDKFFNLTQELR